MSEFSTFRDIKATRKSHNCDACGTSIPAGAPAFYFSQKYEGHFYAGHYHVDCRAAEVALNNARDSCWDEWLGLNCLDEQDDKDWVRENYPEVASRFAWGA